MFAARAMFLALVAAALAAQPANAEELALSGAPARELMPSMPDFSKLMPAMPAAPMVSSSFTADEQPTQVTQVSFGGPSPMTSMTDASPLLDTEPGMEGLTEESTEIVRGIVEAFFHNQALQEGEAECLSKGAGNLAGDVTSMSANLFVLLESAMGRQPTPRSSAGQQGTQGGFHDGASGISDMVDGMMEGGDGVPGADQPPAAEEQAVDRQRAKAAKQVASQNLDFFYGGRRLQSYAKLMTMAPGIAMQTGTAIQKMMGLSHEIVKRCLHKDAVDAFHKSAQHMQSLKYVSGHLVANGEDIVGELADAVTAYKAHNYRKFGSDFGTALRKVFLSNANGDGLPEGKPDPEVVANVTEGLLRGFFGRGSELDLKLPGDIDRAPADIPIDLHQCVSKNLGFFESMWAEVMFFYAKKGAGTQKKEQMQWSTAVAFTMMQLPKALEKCSMGPEQQQMLEDAIKGLASGQEGVSWNFKMPETERVSNDRMEQHLAITVKAWTEKQWGDFGEDLGKLLQEMALTVLEQKDSAAAAFGQKYSLDSAGILRKNLQEPKIEPRASAAGSYLALAVAGAVSISFAAVRRIGAGASREADSSDFADEEGAE